MNHAKFLAYEKMEICLSYCSIWGGNVQAWASWTYLMVTSAEDFCIRCTPCFGIIREQLCSVTSWWGPALQGCVGSTAEKLLHLLPRKEINYLFWSSTSLLERWEGNSSKRGLMEQLVWYWSGLWLVGLVLDLAKSQLYPNNDWTDFLLW